MKPTDTEMVILKHIWSTGPQSQGEIHRALGDAQGWSRSTTRTIMTRMADKNLLKTSKVHGILVFSAAQSKVQTLANLIHNFSRDFLGLSASLPVPKFADGKLLNEDEIKELNSLIEQLAEHDEASQ